MSQFIALSTHFILHIFCMLCSACKDTEAIYVVVWVFPPGTSVHMKFTSEHRKYNEILLCMLMECSSIHLVCFGAGFFCFLVLTLFNQ